MNTDCLICLESHHTSVCPERKLQNCPDSHIYINHFSDHSAVCGMKQWIFQPYANLYATPPNDRVIVGCNAPFRFLYGGLWRRPVDGVEMYSTVSDTIIRFKSENDLVISTLKFAPIRIAVVVKDNGRFIVKLMILASQERFIVLADVNEPFDRDAAKKNRLWKTTLILAVVPTDEIRFDVMMLPPRGLVKQCELRYDSTAKKFIIPNELLHSPSPSTVRQPSQQLVERKVNEGVGQFEEIQHRIGTVDCLMCYDAHHGEYCRRFWEPCFECHVPAQTKTDHAENCAVKNWFVSEMYVDMYVKEPAVRAKISSARPLRYLIHGVFNNATPDVELFSGMADVLFKFESDSKLAIKTASFTRIRIPVVIRNGNTFTERIVFMTSPDRIIVAAQSSRVVNRSTFLMDHEHNTPLILLLDGACEQLVLEVYSGGAKYEYVIDATPDGRKYNIPGELNVKSNHFGPRPFDADLPKKMKRQ